MKGPLMRAPVAVLGALLASGTSGGLGAQTQLRTGDRVANFGSRTLAPGFMPDPLNIPVTSGGSLDARAMNLGPGCVGFVTARPDVILRMTGNSASLRVYVTAPGDTTLLVNSGRGRWFCNDDSFGGRNPTVDLPSTGSGQYDIWVGSYAPGANVQGVLHITEVGSNHP